MYQSPAGRLDAVTLLLPTITQSSPRLMQQPGPGDGFPHTSSAPRALVTGKVPARRAGGAPTVATRMSINTNEPQFSALMGLAPARRTEKFTPEARAGARCGTKLFVPFVFAEGHRALREL